VKLAKVMGMSEPLTMDEILKEKWIMFDTPITGEELLLYDTVPWLPHYFRLSPFVLLKHDKGEAIEWRKEDALTTLQSFYRKPIDWEKQKWVVLVLERVYEGEPKQTLRFSHQYPKLSYPMFTTIRKSNSRSARLKRGDVVEVIVG